MSNPTVINIPEWQWVKVASGVSIVKIERLTTVVDYFWTYRLYGDESPTEPTLGTTPEEATRIFQTEPSETFKSLKPIDVYILCFNGDDDSNEAGKLRIDINIDDNVKEVYLQDQVSDPLEFYLSRKIATTSLTSNIEINTSGDPWFVVETEQITLASGTGAAVGLWIEIWEGSFRFQAEISGVAGAVIDLLKPIGFPFTTDAVVYIVDVDQNKDFTVATGIGPQYYTYDPPSIYTLDTHENRFMVTMLHAAESDASLYGDIGELPKGIVFSGRGKILKRESGNPFDLVVYNNLFNIRINEDYKSTAYDVSFEPKSGNPAAGTLYGTSVRKTFNGQDKSGIVIPVRQERDEATRALFRDNLSTLALHRIKVIGHQVI